MGRQNFNLCLVLLYFCLRFRCKLGVRAGVACLVSSLRRLVRGAVEMFLRNKRPLFLPDSDRNKVL